MRTLPLHGVAGAALLLVGCELPGTECTEAGCIDQVVVTFAPLALSPGDYVLTVGAPGDEVPCAFALPGDPSAPIECGREPFATLFLASDSTLGSFEYGATPDSLTIELARDGVPLFAPQRLTPGYRTSWPNGADCPPSCEFANLELDLSSLVTDP